MDINEEEYIPNWFSNLRLNSREEGIEYILNFMKREQPRFDSMGLRWDEVSKRKKKKK